ncbi:MAG: hypothetical protein V4529_14290 [Gemmatimonadota bacterium]
MYEMPVIPITAPADPTQPVVVDLTNLYMSWVPRNYSISFLQLPPELKLYWDNCNRSADAFNATLEALAAEEQDAVDATNAAAAVQDITCERDLSANGITSTQTLCFDFFIASPTVFFLGSGDDRSFDSNAPVTASRVQLYIDPSLSDGDPHKYKVFINSSMVLVPNVPSGEPWIVGSAVVYSPFPHLPSDVQTHTDLNTGEMTVSATFYNGACAHIYNPRENCPSIDAKFTVGKGSDGRYQLVSSHTDQYPSIQLNERISGQWNEFYRQHEHPGFFGPLYLIEDFAAKKQAIIESLRLPPGCNID